MEAGTQFCAQCGAARQSRLRPPHPAYPASQSCGHCGADNELGYRFCQRCGRPLASVPTDSSSTPASSTPASSTPASSAAISSTTTLKTPIAESPSPLAEPDRPATDLGVLVAIHPDGSEGRHYDLRGPSVDLGRDAALSFADEHLARRHARIFRAGAGRPSIEPLERLNGVYLRIRGETRLESGDTLLVGRQLLRFENLGAEERRPSPLVEHGVALWASMAPPTWGRLSLLLPDGSVGDIRHLCDTEAVIGREEGDIVFREDEFLSRQHARLARRDGAAFLEDLGSSNGTFMRLRGATELASGDWIRIGDQMFRFESGG